MTERILRPMTEKPTVDAVYPVKLSPRCGGVIAQSRWFAGEWKEPAMSAEIAAPRIMATMYPENIVGWYDEPQFTAAAPEREIRVGDRVRLRVFENNTDGIHFSTRRMKHMVGQVAKVTEATHGKRWICVADDGRSDLSTWAWPLSACELVSEEAAVVPDPIDPNAGMIARDGEAKPKYEPTAPYGIPGKPETTALPPNPGLLASWKGPRWLA